MPPRESPLERAAFRWSAVAATGGTLLALLLVWRGAGVAGLAHLGSAAATSILLFGKFVIFLGLHEDYPLSPAVLALLVWMIDVLIAFALASGLERLERAPLLGRWLRRARLRALAVLREYPGLERMAFFGVACFVMLPLAGTGAISGSFAARLVGLRRIPGVLAIVLGSAGTAASFLLLALFLGEQAEELARSPVLIGGTLVGLVVAGWIAWRRITRRLRAR
ncbi:MAG: small multi-drug export protein [Planctomycetota bacterium]